MNFSARGEVCNNDLVIITLKERHTGYFVGNESRGHHQ